MQGPRSLTGSLAGLPFLRNPIWRRTIFVVLIAICGILTLFPQKYRAAVSLTPTDPASLGLSGTLGQLGAVGNVFGNQAAVEVSLKVARSEYVRSIVIKKLNLTKVLDKTPLETHRWLDDHVDIRALRGGIVQFELKARDPELARSIIDAYGTAVREQLAIIARDQTARKRQILEQLVEKASEQLARARTAYDSFRLQTRYSSPQQAIYAAGDRIPELEALIRSKQVQLSAMREFATDENMRVRQARAEIASLQQQLASARSTSPVDSSSVGQVVRRSTEVDTLRRNLTLAQGLYDSYQRYLQGTSVEDLTSSANIRILEPAFIDTSRQYNMVPLGAAILLVLLALALEFYEIRPPFTEQRRLEPTA